MTAFEIVLIVSGAVLTLTAVAVVFRMVVGPTILDRAVATESLMVLLVLAMALYTAHAEANWAGPALLGMTGMGFIGTVTFARFVAREDRRQGQRGRQEEEPEASTGPLEAIHVDEGQDADAEQWPANTVAPTTVEAGTDGAELNLHEQLPPDEEPPAGTGPSADEASAPGAQPPADEGTEEQR